jgi:hypothetical protein
MTNIQKAVQNYRNAGETLLLRAELLEQAGRIPHDTAHLHLRDSWFVASLIENWDAERFVTEGADVPETMLALGATPDRTSRARASEAA